MAFAAVITLICDFRFAADLDPVVSATAHGDELTLSIVNSNPYEAKSVDLAEIRNGRKLSAADIVIFDSVRECNSFENAQVICDKPFCACGNASIFPPHSIAKIYFKKI